MITGLTGKSFDRLKGGQGLTFMESLVTLLLLTFILAFGTNIYSNADRIATMAVHKKIAVETAMAELERLKKEGYAALPEETDLPPPVNIDLEGTPAVQGMTVRDIDEDPPDGHTDYKEVAVTIRWNEVRSQTPREVSMTTLIAP
ncbi:MAG: hypothetical protein JW847_01495 [Candidatus Omnitrophica bacterium]|nr:hypothetical protein [Candidatus Omnitrophota bacterium]